MKMLQRQLSIILLLNIHTSSCVIDAIYDAGKQVWKLYNFVKDDPIADNDSIIQQINRDMDIHQEQICDGPQMVSKILMQLFKAVMTAEMKANMMLTFANIHRYMSNKDGVYWRACDPDNNKWIPGDTFYEIENTFQTSLFRYHWLNCKHDSCADVRTRKCKTELYDYRSSCVGTISNCSYLSVIQACVLKEGPRTFQYVNSTELGFLGNNSKCPADNGYTIEDGTGWNFSYAACVCSCFNERNEISLSIVESNVKFNHVIIGLRFVRSGRTLFIQPKEASLNANGFINRNSQRWIPISKILPPSITHRLNSKNKIFFLDDVRLPPGCVLTGVKFNRVKRETVTGFAIEIFGRNFDYRSGELNLEEDLRVSRKASNINSGKRLSFMAVNSIYTSLPHSIISSDIKYVSLKQSRLTEDFGQSTLPQFDGVPISIDFPSALDGIGIFHKGVEGYAGFLSLRVYGIKLQKYFSDFKAAHIIDDRVLFNDSHYP